MANISELPAFREIAETVNFSRIKSLVNERGSELSTAAAAAMLPVTDKLDNGFSSIRNMGIYAISVPTGYLAGRDVAGRGLGETLGLLAFEIGSWAAANHFQQPELQSASTALLISSAGGIIHGIIRNTAREKNE